MKHRDRCLEAFHQSKQLMQKWSVAIEPLVNMIEHNFLQISLYNVGKIARTSLIEEFSNVVEAANQSQVSLFNVGLHLIDLLFFRQLLNYGI